MFKLRIKNGTYRERQAMVLSIRMRENRNVIDLNNPLKDLITTEVKL